VATSTPKDRFWPRGLTWLVDENVATAWSAALEATMFTGWIYDHLKPHAAALKVAHPLMLRAIAAAKKKNDRIDASKICDCLRCDFLPECYMASTAIRERQRRESFCPLRTHLIGL